MTSAFASAFTTFRRSWSRFWFAPASAFNFALFRTGLGLVTFVWFVTLIPDFDAFFGPEGIGLQPAPRSQWFTIFTWFDSPVFIRITVWLGLIASGMLIAGKLTRVGGPALAIFVPSIMAENQILWNAGDDLLQTFCLLFGLYCLLTPSNSLDIPLQLRDPASNLRRLRNGHTWFFQLVKVQMAAVYLVAFISKVPGSARFPTPSIFENNFFVGNLFTWTSLMLEGLLPLLLWKKKTRVYAIAAAVTFHLAIDWTLTIGLFSWIMILGLSAFLPSDTDTKLRSANRRLRKTLGIQGSEVTAQRRSKPLRHT